MHSSTIDTIDAALHYARATIDQFWHRWIRAENESECLDRIDAALAELNHMQQQDEGGTWQPLANGLYHTDGPEVFRIEGKRLEVYQSGKGEWVNLPAGVAVCRTATPQPTPPIVPDGELLPCPFCGVLPHTHDDCGEGFKVWCENDDCPMQVEYMHKAVEVEAIAAWNERKQPTPASVAVPDDVRERLAEYAHEAWAGWMKYLFEKGYEDFIERPGDGRLERVYIMPEWARLRWQRQMETPYDELPESEKASDRAEADKMLTILSAASVPDDIAETLRYAVGYQLDIQQGFGDEHMPWLDRLRVAHTWLAQQRP